MCHHILCLRILFLPLYSSISSFSNLKKIIYLFGGTRSQLQIQFFHQGLTPHPLYWVHGVLTTRPPGFFCLGLLLVCHCRTSWLRVASRYWDQAGISNNIWQKPEMTLSARAGPRGWQKWTVVHQAPAHGILQVMTWGASFCPRNLPTQGSNPHLFSFLYWA